MMNNKGLTLIELIIVISIIGILVLALGFSFQGWITRYKAESEIKTMFGDLMNAKAKAMGKNRIIFVDFPSSTQYAIYEDTNTLPDGNGTLEKTGSPIDTLILQKTTSYTIAANLMPSNGQLGFTKDGISNKTGTIRLSSTELPDYDCLELSTTRINLGQWNGSSCVSK